MKPLPDLSDDAAMLARGKNAALWSARTDALGDLRDAYTRAQGCSWDALPAVIADARAALDRLTVLIEMQTEIGGNA